MRRSLLALLFLSFTPALWAQTPSIEYTLSAKNPLSHLYRVEMEISGVRTPNLDVAMPAWSPGVYVIRDYAANVQEFEVKNRQNRPLQFQQIDKQTWRITKAPADDVRVQYLVYSTAFNDGIADVTPAAVFMYVVGQMGIPLSVRFETEGGWKVYTALEKRGDRYIADDYGTLAASPAFLGTFKVLEFKRANVPFRVVFSNPRIQMTELQVEADLSDLADAAARMFGVIPFPEYTFFVRVQPQAGATSVGYHNSSRMTVGENDFSNQSGYRGFLTAASQGFVKAWYGTAVRPTSMQPYEFSREAYSRLLWFTEGASTYSADMLLVRSGILIPAEYFVKTSSEVETLQRQPGRLITSLEQAGWNPWSRSENSANTGISYLLKGKIAAFLLDAEIRGKTDGAKSLDDVLRRLLKESATRRTGLPEDGLEAEILAASGINVRTFLDSVVRGKGEMDYNRYLEPLGIRVEVMNGPTSTYLGIEFERAEANQVRIRRVVPGSPAEIAKIDGGDIVLAMDSERITFDNLTTRLHSKPLGKAVSLLVLRGERLLTLSLTPALNQTDAWTVEESPTATPKQVLLREAWMKGNSKD